jgi:hypothetical protein
MVHQVAQSVQLAHSAQSAQHSALHVLVATFLRKVLKVAVLAPSVSTLTRRVHHASTVAMATARLLRAQAVTRAALVTFPTQLSHLYAHSVLRVTTLPQMVALNVLPALLERTTATIRYKPVYSALLEPTAQLQLLLPARPANFVPQALPLPLMGFPTHALLAQEVSTPHPRVQLLALLAAPDLVQQLATLAVGHVFLESSLLVVNAWHVVLVPSVRLPMPPLVQAVCKESTTMLPTRVLAILV